MIVRVRRVNTLTCTSRPQEVRTEGSLLECRIVASPYHPIELNADCASRLLQACIVLHSPEAPRSTRTDRSFFPQSSSAITNLEAFLRLSARMSLSFCEGTS